MRERGPPERVELRRRSLGPLHVFTSDRIGGLHVASQDLRAAFDLVAPIASEIMLRMVGYGVRYQPVENFASFRMRVGLMAALRPADAPQAPELVQQKFLSHRRLIRALQGLGAAELGKKDRHAMYWRTAAGGVFSVMGPTSRTQSGTLLYSEAYARDLLALVGRLDGGIAPGSADQGTPADLVLRLDPI